MTTLAAEIVATLQRRIRDLDVSIARFEPAATGSDATMCAAMARVLKRARAREAADLVAWSAHR